MAFSSRDWVLHSSITDHVFAFVFYSESNSDSEFYCVLCIVSTTIWRRVMELPTIEQLSLHASPSEIEEWVERFELWYSVRRGGSQNQAAVFLTAGGRDMYSLLKNLAFPDAPAKLPFEELKELLLNHVLPADFQATERAKFNSLVRPDNMPCREFILQLNKQAARCNYGDRLEEQLCDRLVAGINNITLQRKLLEKKDLKFAEAKKICEEHDDLVKATAGESITLFQRREGDLTRTKLLQMTQYHERARRVHQNR